MNTARFEHLLNNTVVPSNISHEEQLKRYAPITSYVNSNLPEQLYRFRRCSDNDLEAFLKDQMRQIGRSFLEQHGKNCPDTFLPTKVALHKSSEWNGEAEWRVLCNVQHADSVSEADRGYFIKKPTAVYLGRRIHTINERLLRSLADEKGIPCYKMALNDRSPAYELVAENI